MKRIIQIIITLGLVAGVGSALFVSSDVSAINVFDKCGGSGSTAVCGAATKDDASNMIENVINVMLYLLGSIAVIMIVFGGIRYTTSNGDASRIKAAKETIMYSVAGLIVAILAFAIVNFVLKVFK